MQSEGSTVPITYLPPIQCGNVDCTESALSGQVFCYEHTYPNPHRRDPRIWENLGKGAWRRKSMRYSS